MNQRKEAIVFYSQDCKYSNNLINMIKALNLTNNIEFVHVHRGNIRQLPKYVDRVPLMIKDNTIYKEDSLFGYFENIYTQSKARLGGNNPKNNNQSDQSKQHNDSLLAGYSDLQTNGKFEDNFGFIDDTDQFSMKNTSYEYISDSINNEEYSNQKPISENISKSNKFNSADYDSFIQNRDSEISNIFNSRSKPI
jgi:hypothetical protein